VIIVSGVPVCRLLMTGMPDMRERLVSAASLVGGWSNRRNGYRNRAEASDVQLSDFLGMPLDEQEAFSHVFAH
jgi:hypothetical protein